MDSIKLYDNVFVGMIQPQIFHFHFTQMFIINCVGNKKQAVERSREDRQIGAGEIMESRGKGWRGGVSCRQE